MTRDWKLVQQQLNDESAPFRIKLRDPNLSCGRTSYMIEVTAPIEVKSTNDVWVKKIMGASVSFDFTPSLKFLRQIIKEVNRVLVEKLNAGEITIYSLHLSADGWVQDTCNKEILTYVEWRFDEL